MYQIETALGFGYQIPHALITEDIKKQNYGILRPMCHTCGQTSYFLGQIIDTINSRKGWKAVDIKEFTDSQKDIYAQAYKDIFGVEPKGEPQYILFTDIKRF